MAIIRVKQWDGTFVELPFSNGYTPVKGTDYWTEEDKEEIMTYVSSGYVPNSAVGAPNGVASLDLKRRLQVGQFPDPNDVGVYNLECGDGIPYDADLNDYYQIGTYTFLDSDSSSVSNYPPGLARLTFRLTVMKTGNTTMLQVFVCTDAVCIRYNNRYDNINHYGAWRQFATSDGTPAGAGSTRTDQLQMNKIIWSGSWASGSIAVPYLDNYLIYKINFSQIQTGILVVKNGNTFRGVGGNPSNAQTFRLALFSANRNGDTLTLVDARALDPLNGREDGALTVTNIIGIC